MDEEKVYKPSKARLIIALIVDFFLLYIVIGFFLLPYHLIQYFKNVLTLNASGAHLRRGLFSTSEMDIPYKKINSVSIRRGMLGNMLGYGDIVILTGNDLRGEVFSGVGNPEAIRDEIMMRMRQVETHGYKENNEGNSKVVKNTNDPYKDLEKLAQLKKKGIITDEEFEAKKKQLLNLS